MSDINAANKTLTRWLVLAVVAMFGFGFALVPLYDIMCEQLGINGKPSSSAVESPTGMQVDESRLIKVQFIAQVDTGIPWSFEPIQAEMLVHPGEVIQTAYHAFNMASNDLTGQAVPSVSPGLAATYFNKIECFCFNKQPLAGQTAAELPVVFYIEPDIPESIHTLTLSYTLFKFKENTTTEPTESVSNSAVNDKLAYQAATQNRAQEHAQEQGASQ